MTISPARSTGCSVSSSASTAPAGIMIQTIRGAGSFATRSAAEVAAAAPASARARAAPALLSYTTQLWPALARRRTMFEPMRPRPIIPIFTRSPVAALYQRRVIFRGNAIAAAPDGDHAAAAPADQRSEERRG